MPLQLIEHKDFTFAIDTLSIDLILVDLVVVSDGVQFFLDVSIRGHDKSHTIMLPFGLKSADAIEIVKKIIAATPVFQANTHWEN